MALTEEEVHAALLEVGDPGLSSIITGARGKGKTALGCWLAEWFRQHDKCEICYKYGLNPKGWWILSNIILIEKGNEAVEKYPPRWVKVRSFAELMFNIGKILHKDRRAKIFWLIDEGASSFSIYESVFTKRQRSMISFLTQARKLRLASAIITLSPRIVHKQLRDVRGQFLACLFRKESHLIQERARHLLGKHDERSIVIMEWPVLSKDDYELLIINTADPNGPTLAMPARMVPEGRSHFDTESAAMFEMGTMIGASHKPFVFEKFLSWISDCPSAQVPSRIIEYFQLEGEVEIEAPLTLLQPESVVKGTPQWSEQVVIPVVIEELRGMGASLKESNRALAAKLRPLLLQRHDTQGEPIDISIDRLRKNYIPKAKKRLTADNEGLIIALGDVI